MKIFAFLTHFIYKSNYTNCHINLSHQFVWTHLCLLQQRISPSKAFTSSSCLMWGRNSLWNDSNAPLSLSSNVLLFKLVLLFDALLSPFLASDKISKTWLSLWTSRTIAWICLLIKRCCKTFIMQVFSISSWCFSSWKVELIHPKSPIRETSSLKLVAESWKS